MLISGTFIYICKKSELKSFILVKENEINRLYNYYFFLISVNFVSIKNIDTVTRKIHELQTTHIFVQKDDKPDYQNLKLIAAQTKETFFQQCERLILLSIASTKRNSEKFKKF